VSRRQYIGLWLGRWGFPVSVGLAALIGLVVGATVAVPVDIPGVALRAAAVYRLEVGGAIFVGLYIATMALVLALQNRGITEVGGIGLRAEELVESRKAVVAQEAALAEITKAMDNVKKRQELEGLE
jgi:hypothetical protein